MVGIGLAPILLNSTSLSSPYNRNYRKDVATAPNIPNCCEVAHTGAESRRALAWRMYHGLGGSLPIWNRGGILIFHISSDTSEGAIILRLSYMGSPVPGPTAPCSTFTGW